MRRHWSPLNQRRWQTFRANRRGWWSLWIFLVLFGLSLFAELIARGWSDADLKLLAGENALRALEQAEKVSRESNQGMKKL